MKAKKKDPAPNANVNAILNAYKNHNGDYDGPEGIVINNIELCVESPSGNAITVTTPDNPMADPIVIVNPPIIVPDHTGGVTVDGANYRVDPLAAVAAVIQQYGGSTQ
jgi:hypothetical protein